MINFKQLHLTLCGIGLCLAFGATLHAQQTSFPVQGGQVVQGQVVQGQPIQGLIVPGQPIQGRIIYGEPVRGQFIEGQAIQGRIIQGPVIQPGVIISEEIIQGQPLPADQPRDVKGSDALRKEIKTLTDENAGLRKRFKEASLTWEQQNKSVVMASEEAAAQKIELVATKKELARIANLVETMAKQNSSMEEKASVLSQENVMLKKQLADGGDEGDAMAELNKLGQQNQTLSQQNETLLKRNTALSREIKALTNKNVLLEKRVASIGNSGGAMNSLESRLKSAASELSGLEEQNQSLEVENNRLQGVLATLNQDKQQLGSRVTVLSGENETLRGQFQRASQDVASLGNRVDSLSSQNRSYANSVNSLKSDLREHSESDAAFATAGAAKIDNDLQRENALLSEQVVDLQDELARRNRESESISTTTPMPLVAEGSGKYNVMRWIIPFLLIGLGVGLYTYFMEEYRGTEGTRTSKA